MKIRGQSRVLFEPDTILPAQFYAAFRGGTAGTGERRLMLAVLEDALECYQKYAFARRGQGHQLFEESDGWIGSTDSNWCFSFENICETLEINPEYLRHGLANWRCRSSRSRKKSRRVAAKDDSHALRRAG